MKSREFRTDPLFLRDGSKKDGVFKIPIIKKQDVEIENIELIGYNKVS